MINNKNFTQGSYSSLLIRNRVKFILIRMFPRVYCHTSLPKLFQTGQREEALTGLTRSKFNEVQRRWQVRLYNSGDSTFS